MAFHHIDLMCKYIHYHCVVTFQNPRGVCAVPCPALNPDHNTSKILLIIRYRWGLMVYTELL